MPLNETVDEVIQQFIALGNPLLPVAPVGLIQALADVGADVLINTPVADLFTDIATNVQLQTALQNEVDQRTQTDRDLEVQNVCVVDEGETGRGSRQVSEVERILNTNGQNLVNRWRAITTDILTTVQGVFLEEQLARQWLREMSELHECIEELAEECSFPTPEPVPRKKVPGMVTRCVRYEGE